MKYLSFMYGGFICFLSIFLFRCESINAPCTECPGDQGLIVSANAGPVEGDCGWRDLPDAKAYIIQSDSAYKALEEISRDFAILNGCLDLSFQPVDFDKYDVLTMAANGSGCERLFCTSVEDDSRNQEYVFQVKLIECGGCEPWIETRLWVVVPKIPDNYTVAFRLE